MNKTIALVALQLVVGGVWATMVVWIDNSWPYFLRLAIVYLYLILYLQTSNIDSPVRSVARPDYLYILLAIPGIKHANVQSAAFLYSLFLGFAPVIFCVMMSIHTTGRFNLDCFIPQRLAHLIVGSLVMWLKKLYVRDVYEMLFGQAWLMAALPLVLMVTLGNQRNMPFAPFTMIINLHRLQGRIYSLWFQLLSALDKGSSAGVQHGGVRRSAPFTHQFTLKRSQIRLIVLEKRQLGKPPRCRIVRCTLQEPPQFTAISYVWGKSDLDHSLSTTDMSGTVSQIIVTKSAFDILGREQSFFKEKLIWIDTICIDQSNNDEKSEQIGLMRQIYEKASEVHAYMDASMVHSDMEVWLDFFHWGDWDNLTEKAAFDLGWHEAFSEIHKLYNSPWIRRMWILQEAVVPKKISLIYCTTHIPWYVFNDLTMKLRSTQLNKAWSYSAQKMYGVDDLKQSANAISCATELCQSRMAWASNSELHLERLLLHGRSALCSDPRDKIFAVRGLVESSKAQNIPISYSMSRTELHTRTMRALLSSSKSLDCLAYAGKEEPLPERNLPSWVSSWEVASAFPDFHFKPLYKASQRTSFIVSEEGSLYHLQVRAFHFDAIKILSPAFDTEDWLAELLAHRDNDAMRDSEVSMIIRLWALVVKELYAKNDDLRSLQEAFWLTLIADRINWESRRLSRSDRLDLAEETRGMGRFRSNQGLVENLDVDDNFVEVLFDGMWSEDSSERDTSISPNYWVYQREILANLNNRCFGITRAGRMGIFPKQARVGDQVTLFVGAQVPFVTSKVEMQSNDQAPQFTLVGSCYVHGVMDGEADKDVWEDVVLV